MRVRILQLVTVVAGLAVWEVAARSGWVDPLFVPAPSAVAPALRRIGGDALAGLADTLGKTALAYVLSVVLGVSAGIAVGSVRLLRDVLSPYVVALYGIPKILVLPWIVLLLGYGTTPAVFYGTLHGFFPIMVLVMGAVRDVDQTLVTVARSLGATTWQLYWKVLRGMGHVLGSFANGFQAPELFAATALVSAASIAIVLALDHLNDKLSRWRG